MSNGGEFRTSLFGGYNKEDVRSFVQELERNAEVTKFEYEKEIVGLRGKLKKAQEEKELLQNQIQNYNAGMRKSGEARDMDDAALDSYLQDLNDQKQQNELLMQRIRELENQNISLSETKASAEKQLEELKNSETSLERNIQMEGEIRQLQEKKEKYEAELSAITKVFEDARMSAQYIQEEAQRQAQEILNQAEKESQELLERRKNEMDKELEDRGIRLMAARYKIDAYRKEIDSAQQKLYNLSSDLGKMVDGMPQRLEQLWEDNEKSIADIRKK
ncbi:MAG TPA: hypothetical protein IAA06_03660 [Candidatus Blautia faecavium]|uniref:DivIVA domain-containing protein n=1 Tax=Candidatus Blautia faecavium TaxID=2838487 RepID=A0A9D2LSF7_9FIRM|nr:hypothetical protein [Candidatus Blautia faecavium]